MASYRKERQQHKQQNRCAKASALIRQRKSSTRPPPAPIHPCSVVPEKIVILGDAPYQEHRHWCMGRRFPGRAPGFSPWSSPIPLLQIEIGEYRNVLHIKLFNLMLPGGWAPGVVVGVGRLTSRPCGG